MTTNISHFARWRAAIILTALLAGAMPKMIAGAPEGLQPIAVSTGWNLLSLSARVANGNCTVLFPSATSSAYEFHNPAGYQPQTTIQNGVGFWLKFDSTQTVLIQGDAIFRDTIVLETGWNIVGPPSVPVPVDSLRSEPPGIITSQFFRFEAGAGYQEADTLHPGRGYWVKVSQGGSIFTSALGGYPCPGLPTLDYAGKIYNTVQIGNQCWLRENLDVGAMVLSTQGQTDNDTIEKYCYDNIAANCEAFGGLYHWNELMQYDTGQGRQGICPPGWHVPTIRDFQSLSAAVGGDGNALKRIDQGSGGGAGTNESGFAALLAGRCDGGVFSYLGQHTGFYSSTAVGSTGDVRGIFLYNDNSLQFDVVYQLSGFSVRCLKDEALNQPPGFPSNPYPGTGATNISTTPTLTWSCSDPDADPLAYDVYLGVVSPPDTIVSSNQTGSNLPLTSLASGTTYYWKVVAKDNHAHSTEGPVWTFTTYTGGGSPCPGTPTVTYAGKTYNTVHIGSQCWLRENLDVGVMVQGSQNQTNNSIIEKYCYHDSSVNCDTYGGLYQWNEAMQYDTTQGGQGICPSGWHIPTYSELITLVVAVDGYSNALKAIGQGSGAGAGTNTSGFSALLAGYRTDSGGFGSLSNVTNLWGSAQGSAALARMLNLNAGTNSIVTNYLGKDYGFSIRCLKD